MKIKGGMIVLVAIQYEDKIMPESYEILEKIKKEILSERNWNDTNSQNYLSRLEYCAEVIQLRDTLNDLAINFDPELEISWEFLANCLRVKGFNSDLIEVVHSLFKSAYGAYEQIKKIINDGLIFDSQYNLYVYPTEGACIGDLEIKEYLKGNWKDALTDNEYYASLIAEGCELSIGPNFNDPFNLLKAGVYCSNYKEMFELGVLNEDNMMQGTFGEKK